NVSNPVAAILGCAQLLSRLLQRGDADVNRCLSYTAIIEEESQKCARMLDNLAFLARPPKPRPLDLDIHAILDDALAGFHHPENVRITVQRNDALPRAYADPNLLQQALLRVFENALDALPDGGQITVRTDYVEPDDNRVEITMTDNGGGIPSDVLPHVTEPFYTTRQGRNGIGLTVCKSLLTCQQGQLALTAAADGGTRVTFTLPRNAAAANAA
ncbi:MAG TPA: ATP-binding protein, partial [Armatimonadota bacterium]|nr:ATP-binding protein [Armatimonadota bacterium]